jgi:GNAT superfamily N-acetyltransferase
VVSGDFGAGNEASVPPITYRPAVIRDIGAMTLVQERAHAARLGLPLSDELGPFGDNTQQWLAGYMSDPETWAYTAHSSDRLAGFVLGYPSTKENTGTVARDPDGELLAQLMCEPLEWGRGIGGTLLDFAATIARFRGRRYMTLWTTNDNARARQLYERKGYVVTGHTRISPQFGSMVHYRLDL